ncbi:MAG: protein kinase, partial [Planctomycetes bacterium]|nr:protein kinase [Planctomycetota bacterium]
MTERPAHIGVYQILDTLGEGGMGTVYKAEQREPVRRLVALKVIKLGMDSAEVIARFELERRALAAMNHDAIARVFDAGTSERGQPYFVMELVEGLPLNQYCDQHRLSLRQRLELFQRICHGVHHAHQKGVIHRDLKPGNVIVTRSGEEPTPKILDFGLAKATNRDLLAQTVFTEREQILGTPEYMAPEQAAGEVEIVDTRADVYSLGVMLYELLSGELPFSQQQMRRAGWMEIQRVLREVDPPRPSTRVSTMGEERSSYAMSRQVRGDLARELRGDLDWIVMMAMAKEPERRYDSANALAADVERHLAGEPVLAGPPSVRYRLGKLARRYRGALLGVAAVFLALLGGLIVSWRLYLESEANAAEARQNAKAVAIERDAKAALLLAYQASNTVADDPELGLLLAIEAASLDINHDTRNALWKALDALPRTRTLVGGALEERVAPAGVVQAFGAGGSVVVAKRAPELVVADARTGAPISKSTLDAPLDRVALSPDGHFAAATLADRRGQLVDVRSGTARTLTDDACGGFTFSRDSSRCAVACASTGAVHVFDTHSGEEVVQCGERVAQDQFPMFSPCGRYVAFVGPREDRSTSYREEFVVCELRTGAEIGRFGNGRTEFLAFGPDGLHVACPGEGNTVEVRQVRDGALLETLFGHDGPVLDAAFAPNGKTIATASADGTVRLWGADDARELHALRGDQGDVQRVRFAPSGAMLVACGPRTARVWRTASGTPFVTMPIAGRVLDACFDPTSERLLLSTSRPGATQQLVPLDLLGEGRRLAPRELRHAERARFGLLRAEDIEAERLLDEIRQPTDLVVDVEQRLATRDDLDADVRARVLALARERGDPRPSDLNERAWTVVSRSTGSIPQYADALRLA